MYYCIIWAQSCVRDRLNRARELNGSLRIQNGGNLIKKGTALNLTAYRHPSEYTSMKNLEKNKITTRTVSFLHVIRETKEHQMSSSLRVLLERVTQRYIWYRWHELGSDEVLKVTLQTLLSVFWSNVNHSSASPEPSVMLREYLFLYSLWWIYGQK